MGGLEGRATPGLVGCQPCLLWWLPNCWFVASPQCSWLEGSEVVLGVSNIGLLVVGLDLRVAGCGTWVA